MWHSAPHTCTNKVKAKACRLKEFSEQREVDQYLSASGYLPSGVKPFFIALPKASPLCLLHAWDVSTCLFSSF